MIDAQNQIYPNVIPAGTAVNAVSVPILAAPFKTMQFQCLISASANYNIVVYKSNQEILPDPSLAVSASNQFETVGYTDDGTGVNYNAATPYNPNTDSAFSGEKCFNVETAGARWLWIAITSRSAGSLTSCSAALFTR